MVFIIVAVQKGLEGLKQDLLDRGYEVVDAGTYKYPIDAIIYYGSSLQMSYISGNNMPEAGDGVRSNYGVLMINSDGKNIEEIDLMLKTRCYSPLF